VHRFFRHNRRLEVAQERVYGAIAFGLCANLLDGIFQNANHAPGFGRADIFAEVMVLDYGNLADIEREHQLVFGDSYRRVRSQSVPDAKLVKRIDVIGGNVGNDYIGIQQLFVHLDIDIAGLGNFVGANALVVRSLHRRLDDVFVRGVQIERSARLIIHLFPVAHHHEAGFLGHISSPPYRYEPTCRSGSPFCLRW
jgi:hypothetical protein